MRIGILSLPLHTNYGGLLQAYALQTTLEGMGHKVKIIDRQWVPDLSLKQMLTQLPARFLKKYILRQKINFWPDQHYNALKYLERSQYTRQFIFRNLHLRKTRNLKRICRFEFDAIVVGSDQVWRPRYFAGWGDIENAYLQFARNWNIKRLSYAASFGCEEWEYTEQQTENIRRLVSLFNGVSVREKSGERLCREHLGVDATHVLEPTLLLDMSDYERLFIECNTPQSKGTLFNYILDADENKRELVDRIAKDKGLMPFRVNESESLVEHGVQAPVESWLRAFHDAEFIVTDSFHACVFSVIFHKPFLAVGNADRGLSRFTSLMSMLKLQNNLVVEASDYNSQVDYCPGEETYESLTELQKLSLDFLKSVL